METQKYYRVEKKTYNAQDPSKDTGGTPILNANPIDGTHLTQMGLAAADLPDGNFVVINVDANGEVELDIQPYP